MSRNTRFFILLSFLFLLLFLLDVIWGSVSISLTELWNTILHPTENSLSANIFYQFRIPKAITALLAGAALSGAGLLMQTLFRNPLAGPDVLGVSSGAGMGVALYVMAASWWSSTWMNSSGGIVVAAITGALVILLLILGIAARIRQATTLLIVGLMIAGMAGAVVSILQNVSNPDAVKLFLVWTFGSLSGVTWNQLQLLVPLVFIGLFILFWLQKNLNAMLLGEHYARGLGVSVKTTRIISIVTTGILAGTITAFAGPIAFIGVAVPHLARGIFGTSNHRIVTPGTLLCGASLLLLCDIVSQQTTYPLPLNAVSALFGAPLIIWIILKPKNLPNSKPPLIPSKGENKSAIAESMRVADYSPPLWREVEGEACRVESLSIGYNRKHVPFFVQKNLNLMLNRGEMVCMIGPNGCGKSTLLRTIAGLQKPLQGSVSIDGKDMTQLTVHEKSTLIALTLTEQIEVERMTVSEMTAMGRYPYTNRFGRLTEEDCLKVEQSIEQVQLTNKSNCFLRELSDGERQRAMIAKVLAQDTPLLLFDEPTAHLDLPNRVSILLLLKKLAKDTGKSIVLSTHELELAMQIADRLWLMSDNGMECGAPADLIERGNFQSVFQSDLFSFNVGTGTFTVKQK